MLQIERLYHYICTVTLSKPAFPQLHRTASQTIRNVPVRRRGIHTTCRGGRDLFIVCGPSRSLAVHSIFDATAAN